MQSLQPQDPEAVLRDGYLANVPRKPRVSRGSLSKDGTHLRCVLAVIGIHISEVKPIR